MIQTFSTLELWCLLYLVQEFKEFIIYDKKIQIGTFWKECLKIEFLNV